jgi:hypothetical protein
MSATCRNCGKQVHLHHYEYNKRVCYPTEAHPLDETVRKQEIRSLKATIKMLDPNADTYSNDINVLNETLKTLKIKKADEKNNSLEHAFTLKYGISPQRLFDNFRSALNHMDRPEIDISSYYYHPHRKTNELFIQFVKNNKITDEMMKDYMEIPVTRDVIMTDSSSYVDLRNIKSLPI